ncbi:MAG: efflux RND transporter permease subunit, partial [Myxococcota bacterium]
MQDGLQRLVRSWVERPFLASIVLVLVGVGGLIAIPFDVGFPIRDPVPVDALPDVGENQQIVFTEWPGRSPKDVDDQITYPLSSALLGLGGVETVRATSMFGFSVVYVIFAEGISFPRARSAILEKLASLPADTLPAEVTPRLGPEATGVGQIFWYALVPRLPDGTPDGTAFALHELRSIQDFSVKPALQSVPGV